MAGRKREPRENDESRLWESENKAIVDRLRSIEKTMNLLLKERTENRKLLEELELATMKLTLALEESIRYVEELEAKVFVARGRTEWN